MSPRKKRRKGVSMGKNAQRKRENYQYFNELKANGDIPDDYKFCEFLTQYIGANARCTYKPKYKKKKPIPKYKYFGKHRYTLLEGLKGTKAEIQRKAKAVRKKGYLIRVITLKREGKNVTLAYYHKA